MSDTLQNIGVAHPGTDSYSETFITEHIRRLSGRVTVFHQGFFPKLVDGKPVLSTTNRLGNAAIRRLPIVSKNQWIDGRNQGVLARRLKQHGVQILLAEYAPTATHCMVACHQANIPLVAHFHGMDAFDREMIGQYQSAYTRLFEQCAGIIVGTDDMFEQLLRLGAPEKKLHKNPCGADIDQFRPASEPLRSQNLVAVGRFVEKKAPHLSLLAFARIASRHPDAKLILIGDGELLDTCRQIVRGLKLEDRVVFTGPLPPDQVSAQLRTAYAYVQHSVTSPGGDSEGTSISVLEGSASGLPVISTFHGGIKESVVHGETGFLVDEYDIDGMAGYMDQLLDDRSLAIRLGEHGRKRMESHYSLQVSIANLDRILNDVHAAFNQKKHR